MENAIKFLRIQNFKSIKDVTLHPRRVNLIIGEPNVGKSNLRATGRAQPSGYRELTTFVAEVMDSNSRLWQQ